MAKENVSSKIITIILVLIISIAAITIIYVSLPKTESNESTNNENQNGEEPQQDVLLQVIYGDIVKDYTLNELEDLESFTGLGGYINKVNVTSGPFELTGVRISTFLNQFDINSENYNITVTASDGTQQEFNISNIKGEIPIFNETGVQIGNSGVIMILSYKIDNEYIDVSDGPLRLTFDYDAENSFTSSNLWVKNVVSIEITDI